MPGFNVQDPHDGKGKSTPKSCFLTSTRQLWHTHKAYCTHTHTHKLINVIFFLNQTLAPPSISAGSLPSTGPKQGLLQAGQALPRSRRTAEIHPSCLSKPQKTLAAAMLHLLPVPRLGQVSHCWVSKFTTLSAHARNGPQGSLNPPKHRRPKRLRNVPRPLKSCLTPEGPLLCPKPGTLRLRWPPYFAAPGQHSHTAHHPTPSPAILLSFPEPPLLPASERSHAPYCFWYTQGICQLSIV